LEENLNRKTDFHSAGQNKVLDLVVKGQQSVRAHHEFKVLSYFIRHVKLRIR
jgi:hypothetical protein